MRHVIPYFSGINEQWGAVAGDASAAVTALNIVTGHGRLSCAPGVVKHLPAALPGVPTRLYVFTDRVAGRNEEYVVAGTQQGVYAWKNGAWRPLFVGAQGGDWGFLTYQKGDDTLLIFGNGLDAVKVWNGQDTVASNLPGAPAKGRFFALHYERVWMCGDPATPDRVYYSRALDPENWTADVEIPDRGGGFVELPTFDGGMVTNLYRVGSDLCVLKSTTALLLYGASPQSYQVMEMAGSLGTIAGRTAAVAGQSGYFICAQGIGVQTGTSLSLLDDRKLPRLFDPSYCVDCDPCREGLSPNFGACAVGLFHGERLYFALPLGESAVNDILLEYDLTRETYMIHTGLDVVGLARSGSMREQLLLLDRQGQVLRWGEGAWRQGARALWVTPWLDFGNQERKTLTGFSLFGKIWGERQPAVTVTLESDTGRKQRVLVPRGSGEQRFRRQFRLTGRRFRARIESLSAFCFSGGLELEVK